VQTQIFRLTLDDEVFNALKVPVCVYLCVGVYLDVLMCLLLRVVHEYTSLCVCVCV
jgi:hypothetical protein